MKYSRTINRTIKKEHIMQLENTASSQLMVHCGGNIVTRDQLFALDTPAATATHHPMPHSDLLEMIEDSVTRKFKVDVDSLDAAYGVSADHQQLFGVIAVKLDSDEHSISYGFRNCHKKALSVGLTVGARVFVCDNLAFSSSGISNLARKHTKNVRDMRFRIEDAVQASTGEYDKIVAGWERMKTIPCSTDESFSAVGRAQGRGVLLPNQAAIAFKEIKKPSHVEFAEQNVYSLYNHFTEAAKKGSPALAQTRYPKISEFFDTEFMH
jgi:hypothetical protein